MLYNKFLQTRLKTWSSYMIYTVLLITTATLTAWILNIERFKHVFSITGIPDLLSSLLFLLSGIAFLLITKPNRRLRIAGYNIAAVIMIIGFLSALSIYSAWNIKPDYFLFENILKGKSNYISERMTMGSAINFFITGLFLLTIHVQTSGEKVPAHLGVIFTLFAAWFSITGYLYKVNPFYGVFTYTPMPILSAVCFFLISLSAFFAYPDKGIMKLVTGVSSGSVVARRLIPAAIIIPTILGLLKMYGQWVNLVTDELGISIFVLSIIVIFLGIIWYNSVLLNIRENEKKAVEEVLRYNTTLLENISDAIISTDDIYNIKSWNKHAEELYGWKEHEVKGKPIDTILQIEYPEEKSDRIMHALFTQGHWSGEVVHRNKKGEKLNVFISGSILRNGSGKPKGIVSVMRNITQRKKAIEQVKESELRLQTIIDSYNGPIYAKNNNGELIIWNKACEKATGIPFEEVQGKTVSQLFPGDFAERYMAKDKEVLTNFETAQFEEKFMLDGKEKYYTVILFPMINMKGEVYGICGICIDITSRKQLEENLRLFNEQLEAEVKERTKQLRQLAAHLNNIREEERILISREIHDELGQQLTVIKMDISWLNKKLATTDPSITRKISQIINLVNDAVITVRRIASQLRPGVLDDLGLTAAIEWQLHELEKRTGIKTVFFSDEIPAELPETVKTGMFRILQESLTNVARHADATQVQAEIKHIDNRLVLRIQDNGKGFDSSKAARKTLGLLGMKERAIVMGGKYSISSSPGAGTTVLIDVAV